MKKLKFRTIRNITFVFVTVLLVSGLTQDARAADSLYDRLFGSNEIVTSFLADAEIVVLPNSTDDDLAPLATETWSGLATPPNVNLWTANDNWVGVGGAGPDDDLIFPPGGARQGNTLRNAVVSLIDSLGVRRTATTSSFGLYSFNNVRTGETYTMTVASKRFRFTPQILQFGGSVSNMDFVGLE